MDDKRTPMEAEVQELPPKREPICPVSSYGTAARPRPRRSYTWLWICVGLAVIAVCSFSVVAALSHVRLENRDGSLHLGMKTPPETQSGEDAVRDLPVSADASEPVSTPSGAETVRLPSAGTGDSLEPSALYAAVSPAVVCVRVDSYYGSAVYTGVVISSDGYLLSATEGLSNATAITVSFPDGSAYSARRVGEDRVSGVCLLKVEAEGLRAASFSEESELSVGRGVYCICNPYGSQLPNVFREGMISVCSSVELGGQSYTLVQSSAQQSAGSGCPVLDSRGNVLALTAPIGKRLVSGEDPCFAVSASDLARIVAGLEGQDAGDSRWLGLEVSDIPEEYQYLYSFPGSLWIESVAVGSAPYGVLYQYDVITAVDGEEVSSAAAFERALAAHEPGDRVRLTIYRSGKWYTILLPVLAR